jgi:hypothetical protein
MLNWTTKGAVSTPTTLQVRVERRYPGRIRAGAPQPSRSLTPDELTATIRHFTDGLRGPRTRPCSGLVLSGAGVLQRADLADAVALARELGVLRVVVHVDPLDLPHLPRHAALPMLDTVVLPVQPGATLPHARAALASLSGVRAHTHTVLWADALPELSAVADMLAEAAPAGAAFSYPFPGAAPAAVATPVRAVAELGPALDRLQTAGVHAWVNGLPACFLGPHAASMRRTGNRWYVDADHQADAALLFLPDVLRFDKGDACRFCAADPVCDGFFDAWLARPGWPALRPLDQPPDTI